MDSSRDGYLKTALVRLSSCDARILRANYRAAITSLCSPHAGTRSHADIIMEAIELLAARRGWSLILNEAATDTIERDLYRASKRIKKNG